MSKSNFFEPNPLMEKMLELARSAYIEVKQVLPKAINDPQAVEGLTEAGESKLDDDLNSHFKLRSKVLGDFIARGEYLEAKVGDNFYKEFINMTDRIMQSKIAACDEYSLVALRFLFEKIVNDKELSKIIDAELVDFEEKDHVFIRIFPRSESLDDDSPWEQDPDALSQSVILDCWSNSFNVFSASQMKEKLDDGENGRYEEGDVLDNSGITVSKLEKFLKLSLEKKEEVDEGIKMRK